MGKEREGSHSVVVVYIVVGMQLRSLSAYSSCLLHSVCMKHYPRTSARHEMEFSGGA